MKKSQYNVNVMYISVSGYDGECGSSDPPCPPWEACNIHLPFQTCVKINGEFSRRKSKNVSSLFFCVYRFTSGFHARCYRFFFFQQFITDHSVVSAFMQFTPFCVLEICISVKDAQLPHFVK